MIRQHLAERNITDPEVLRAMEAVPREAFILPSEYDEAYDDHPLRIGCGQTISQPYIVAYMTQLLKAERGMKVLEIGTGSGYQTAVLAELGLEIVSIERHEPLLDQAVERLEKLGYAGHVEFLLGDGSVGSPEDAPFERIIVTAASPRVPDSLVQQLADGGRMVIPVGIGSQRLVVVERHGERLDMVDGLGVIFVKLVGEEGFEES
ncbi:MAG: protein-L-isoaspartate(D-aspartate) O-methyltransferase [Planctomycetes bacterium]|nr:protein-L-isoaspartate(D-aspartate) O-methyltransferase [Planctomycetota bacterium]